MRELLVLRHAKSSWADPGLDDHDRPLNKRGKRDAPRMGRWMKERGVVPGMILSSTAARARATARESAQASGFEGRLVETRDLYLAAPGEYLKLVARVDTEISRVMVVGHNPGVEELVQLLTGEDAVMPTAALAQIALEIESWSDLTPRSRGRLLAHWIPKELPDEVD